jgi:hypothetical protein
MPIVDDAMLQEHRELTLHVRVLQATAAAAPNLAGMHVGWSQSLERLGELVATL